MSHRGALLAEAIRLVESVYSSAREGSAEQALLAMAIGHATRARELIAREPAGGSQPTLPGIPPSRGQA